MVRNGSFAVLILTHRRPDSVHIARTLWKCGYTGDTIIVLGNEDLKIDRYHESYGNICVFDKKRITSETDEGDNLNNRRAVVYARGASLEMTEEKGYQYSIRLDDDYTESSYAYNQYGEVKQKNIISLNRVFDALIDLKNKTGALAVTLAQKGDFIGGKQSNMVRGELPKWKTTNPFICDTDMPFRFFGKINEGVGTYTLLGSRENSFFQIPHVSLDQAAAQQSSGGVTDIYLDSGTYVKSFYTVIYAPSYIKIRPMGSMYRRSHHSINWDNTIPEIIPEDCRR